MHATPPRHAVERLVRVPRQVEPLRQLDLRHQKEDRHGGQPAAGLRARCHRASFAVQPPLGHQQARTPAPVDEPQAQTGPAFPLAGGDPAAARAFPRRWGGDGQQNPFRDRISGPVSCAPTITGAFDQTSAAAFRLSPPLG